MLIDFFPPPLFSSWTYFFSWPLSPFWDFFFKGRKSLRRAITVALPLFEANDWVLGGGSGGLSLVFLGETPALPLVGILTKRTCRSVRMLSFLYDPHLSSGSSLFFRLYLSLFLEVTIKVLTFLENG